MATTQPVLPTLDDVLGYVRAWASAEHARDYRRAQYYKTLLLETIALLPNWALPPAVEPAAETTATLSCGASVRLANDDGALVVSLRDDETNVVAALLPEEAVALQRDLRRVMAAMNGGEQ
jgi:hypothetical protein